MPSYLLSSDKHLELLSKLMRYYNAAAEAYARFRAWLASNGALALALLIIVIAVLLKWLGWM